MNILVTGCAGFIGFHLCLDLISKKKVSLFGIDNLNSYYDIKLKKDRLKILKKKSNNFLFKKIDLINFDKLDRFFKKNKFDIIINLAAQAGVRYSLSNPDSYFKSNILGFYNIIELSKKYKIKHFIYASSSSVYGEQKKFPLKEQFDTDKPISFYGATKKSNEILAHSYSKNFKLKTTGIRFFTVYGPYGRPDMALFKFTQKILSNKSIELYNYGKMYRDFTYIDDAIRGINIIIRNTKVKKSSFEIYNIASSKPQTLKKFISIIERNLKIKIKYKLLPLQKGDVVKTHASIKKLKGFRPKISIEKGISNFINWYRLYYKIK